MIEEKDGQPAVEPTPETTETEQLNNAAETLPDAPASEIERLKAEKEEVVKQADTLKVEKEKLEQQVKDSLAYISRTRNVEKPPEPLRPQKTLDEYLDEVTKRFEDDPKEGLKRVIRDIAHDRDLEREDNDRRVIQAEERAFKKAMSLNPDAGKALKEIEEFDEKNPDMQGLSFERKVEFINLRKVADGKRESDVRDKVTREVGMAGSVGSGGTRRGERSPTWVNDPEVVREAREAGFKTKDELVNWSDPEKAKAMYEQQRSKQR